MVIILRTLLLLRGAPGAGKSTWIKENNLKEYVLEADKFRTLIANPTLNENGDFHITQENDKTAWDMLFQALEFRMKNGEFTIIDATHSNPHMFSKYKKLCERYRYRLYYKQFDVDLQTLIYRNQTREEYKRVPTQSVERIHSLIENTQPQTFATKVDDVSEIMNYFTANLDKYKEIKIIGDIQGCASVLKDAIGTTLDPEIFYVFTGDLLDRGIENREVLDFMLSIYNKPNVILVEGNHDTYLHKWAHEYPERLGYDFVAKTLPQLLKYKELKNIQITIENDKYYIDSKDTGVKVYTKHGEILEKPHLFYHDGFICVSPFEGATNYTKTSIPCTSLTEQDIATFKSDVRKLTKRFRAAFAFEYHNQKYFVCHAGISSIPEMTKISTKQLIHGVGDYETEIDESFEKNYQRGRTQGFIQIHGHRKTKSTKHSICLEDGVENGGNLCVYRITKDTKECLKFKNDVFNIKREKQKTWINQTLNDTTNNIVNHKYVKVKQLDKNLMSLNFSEKAFQKGVWELETITARGLFVDQTTGDIKLRSYNKFFNLQERPITSVAHLKETLSFPIKAYKKYNGFLGIMSVVDDKIVLATKSQTYGEYVDYFKEIFDTLTPNEQEQFKHLAKEYNCSFIFEVEHLNDRHIIDFDQNRLFVLDAVPNNYEFDGIDIDAKFSNKVLSQLIITSEHLKQKEFIGEFDSMEELLRYVKLHTEDTDIEGLVVQDQVGMLFKVKYDYYKRVKRCRTLRDLVRARYYGGNLANLGKTAEEVKFITWCQNQTYEYLKTTHIIDLYKQYINNIETEL